MATAPITMTEYKRRAAKPRPDYLKDYAAYQCWWRARRILGLSIPRKKRKSNSSEKSQKPEQIHQAKKKA